MAHAGELEVCQLLIKPTFPLPGHFATDRATSRAMPALKRAAIRSSYGGGSSPTSSFMHEAMGRDEHYADVLEP